MSDRFDPEYQFFEDIDYRCPLALALVQHRDVLFLRSSSSCSVFLYDIRQRSSEQELSLSIRTKKTLR